MDNLRTKLIKLAHDNHQIRPFIFPILIKTAQSKRVPLPGIIQGYSDAGQELMMLGPEVNAKLYAATMLKALTQPLEDNGKTVMSEPTYNEYDARKVGKWALKIEQMFPGVMFLPGREYSAVLYVKADPKAALNILKLSGRIGADERGIYTSPTSSGQHISSPAALAGMTEPVYIRLWWD